MEDGYIKIFRSIQKWEWYDDANTMRVFIHLLINANWKASRYHGYDVPAGGLVIGRKKLADDLGMSERAVRTALEHLKMTNELTIKTTNKFSIITIVKWEIYQGCDGSSDQQNDQQMTNNRPTTDQQLTTEEENKNIRKKEDKNIDPETTQKVLSIYHKNCGNLKRCFFLTKVAAENINVLLNEFDVDKIQEVFKKANAIKYLSGNNKNGWVADIEWLTKKDNFLGIINGKYDDYNKKPMDFHRTYDFDELEKELKNGRL